MSTELKTTTFTEKQIRNRTIISFIVFIVFIALLFFGWRWLHQQPKEEGAYKPLRRTLQANENLFGRLVKANHLAKTYPVSAADKNVRFNGSFGMQTPLDTAWRLVVVKGAGDTLRLTLNELRMLPKTEIVFDFKCIEGWSQVTHWGGVRLKDFLDHYGLMEQQKMSYMGLNTPDGQYYVGIDMPSALHQQTLLCYEVNGHMLPIRDGYPLRLIIPVKYGVKHLKRIGTMYFSNQPPPDYWAQRGYDYFAGL